MRLTGEQLLARQLLREWGCSSEYADAIADRVLGPGPLNAGDAEWLNKIRAYQRESARTSNPRWASAN